jgi:transport system permease protein
VLVQALTRNPLAEPGLLGVNAGAACAVAIGLGLARSLPIAMMMLVSLVGALVSGLVVTGAAGAWRGRHDPVRIVLVGAAWSAVVSAITTVMLLSDPRIYAEFRFWDAGAVMPRPLDLVIAAAGTLGAGLLAALLLARSMDALALGEEFAKGLGLAAGRARMLVALTCLVLCAAATALVGPVSFLGLIAPFAARLVVGPRHRSLIWFSALLGGVTLLAADVLGRVVNPPAEVQAALMCALLGAPLFIGLARARRGVQL